MAWMWRRTFTFSQQLRYSTSKFAKNRHYRPDKEIYFLNEQKRIQALSSMMDYLRKGDVDGAFTDLEYRSRAWREIPCSVSSLKAVSSVVKEIAVCNVTQEKALLCIEFLLEKFFIEKIMFYKKLRFLAFYLHLITISRNDTERNLNTYRLLCSKYEYFQNAYSFVIYEYLLKQNVQSEVDNIMKELTACTSSAAAKTHLFCGLFGAGRLDDAKDIMEDEMVGALVYEYCSFLRQSGRFYKVRDLARLTKTMKGICPIKMFNKSFDLDTACNSSSDVVNILKKLDDDRKQGLILTDRNYGLLFKKMRHLRIKIPPRFFADAKLATTSIKSFEDGLENYLQIAMMNVNTEKEAIHVLQEVEKCRFQDVLITKLGRFDVVPFQTFVGNLLSCENGLILTERALNFLYRHRNEFEDLYLSVSALKWMLFYDSFRIAPPDIRRFRLVITYYGVWDLPQYTVTKLLHAIEDLVKREEDFDQMMLLSEYLWDCPESSTAECLPVLVGITREPSRIKQAYMFLDKWKKKPKGFNGFYKEHVQTIIRNLVNAKGLDIIDDLDNLHQIMKEKQRVAVWFFYIRELINSGIDCAEIMSIYRTLLSRYRGEVLVYAFVILEHFVKEREFQLRDQVLDTFEAIGNEEVLKLSNLFCANVAANNIKEAKKMVGWKQGRILTYEYAALHFVLQGKDKELELLLQCLQGPLPRAILLKVVFLHYSYNSDEKKVEDTLQLYKKYIGSINEHDQKMFSKIWLRCFYTEREIV